jgi:hypothetical protein
MMVLGLLIAFLLVVLAVGITASFRLKFKEREKLKENKG